MARSACFRSVMSWRADDREFLGFLLAHPFSLQMDGEVRSVGQHDPMVDIARGPVTD